MKINLEIEYNSGEKVEVVCSTPDIVKFEERYDMAITRAANEMKVTHLLFLAHSALHRTKATDLDFNAWVETVDGVGSVTSPKSKG